MLVPSKKIFYAIEAVLYIAYNAKAGPIAGNDIAAAQNLPTRYLEPMMQKLVRAGILRGMRGPQGGYILGRERRRITLADICTALAGEDALPESNTALGQQILSASAQTLMESWQEQLASTTIDNLCDKANAAAIATAHEPTNNFMI